MAHGFLLEKLRTFGITDEWFRSYLTGRVQIVKVGNAVSKPRPVCCGIVAVRQSFGGLGLKLNTSKTHIMLYAVAAILCPT